MTTKFYFTRILILTPTHTCENLQSSKKSNGNCTVRTLIFYIWDLNFHKTVNHKPRSKQVKSAIFH